MRGERAVVILMGDVSSSSGCSSIGETQKLHQLCIIKLAPLSSLPAGTAWMGAGEKLAPPAPDVHIGP